MNKKKEKKQRSHEPPTKYSAKAMANLDRRNGWVCSYISKCRIRTQRQRQWLTSYDQFNEYEQNHTFINFKMTVFMITWVFDVDFSSSVLLDFPFLFFFVYTYIWVTYDHHINWRIRRARIQQMDFMLEMSDYYHHSLNCSIHQIAPIGTWKEKRDLRQKVSTPCDDFSLSLLFYWRLRKTRDQENGRKKSSTMIIASHLVCDARMTKEKNSNILSIYTFPFFSHLYRWTL